MVENTQLCCLAEKMQNAYAREVRRPVQHHRRSPDQIGEEELRRYLPSRIAWKCA